MAVKKRVEGASRSPLAERILAQRARGGAEVSLERLEADFADASRYDIVASLKELEKAGRGQFMVGRKGQRSRFVWGAAKGGSAASSEQPELPPKSGSVRKPSARKAEPAAKPLAATKPAASKPEPASKAVPPLKPVPATKHVRIAKKVATRAGRGSTASAPAVSEPVPAPSIEPKPKASPRGRSVPKIEPLELETVSNPDGGAGSASTAPLGRSRGLERERGSSSPLKHSFHLRPGVRVEIELPENVTVSEVDRFCSFLKTIPFAGD